MENFWIGLIIMLIALFIFILITTIIEIKAEKLRNTDFEISCKRIEGQLRKNGHNIDSYNLNDEEKIKWEQDDKSVIEIIEEFRNKHYTEDDIKSIIKHYKGNI